MRRSEVRTLAGADFMATANVFSLNGISPLIGRSCSLKRRTGPVVRMSRYSHTGYGTVGLRVIDLSFGKTIRLDEFLTLYSV